LASWHGVFFLNTFSRRLFNQNTPLVAENYWILSLDKGIMQQLRSK